MKFFVSILLGILLSALLSSSFSFVLINGAAHADENLVIEEANFAELAQQMKRNKKGLVLMLHADYCSFCKELEDAILAPMIRSGEYDQRVFIRKLNIDAQGIVDFNNKTIDAFDVANRYGSSFTPTLFFLDHQGKEAAVKMIGLNSVDYFGAEVDAQINEMMKSIQTAPHNNVQTLPITN